MEPIPDVDMLKGGFQPIIELVNMDKYHSPFLIRKAHRFLGTLHLLLSLCFCMLLSSTGLTMSQI